ncbi:hypothetical protein B296_00003033 [Ensete ventricosum]|uniref:Uncharacterized protein n=1 Tax=Ensete ventricosum TaxID=4639 RepID=A0A427A7X8_ENSVE|nr:hypothetical protein B296_00003033 [Ensete ventricosum]
MLVCPHLGNDHLSTMEQKLSLDSISYYWTAEQEQWQGRKKEQWQWTIDDCCSKLQGVQRQGRKKGHREGSRAGQLLRKERATTEEAAVEAIAIAVGAIGNGGCGRITATAEGRRNKGGRCCFSSTYHRNKGLRSKHDCGRGKKKQRRPMLLLQHLSPQQGVTTGDGDAAAKQR